MGWVFREGRGWKEEKRNKSEGKEENTARRRRKRRWSYRSGSASRISLVWGVPCSIDIGRTPLPSLLSLPEGRGGKPRGSGVNELKEEASSNQSSRDGFSLNVLRGNRVCYGGLSETIFFFFFFERNLIGIVSNSCEIDFLFFLRREGFKLRYL